MGTCFNYEYRQYLKKIPLNNQRWQYIKLFYYLTEKTPVHAMSRFEHSTNMLFHCTVDNNTVRGWIDPIERMVTIEDTREFGRIRTIKILRHVFQREIEWFARTTLERMTGSTKIETYQISKVNYNTFLQAKNMLSRDFSRNDFFKAHEGMLSIIELGRLWKDGNQQNGSLKNLLETHMQQSDNLDTLLDAHQLRRNKSYQELSQKV